MRRQILSTLVAMTIAAAPSVTEAGAEPAERRGGGDRQIHLERWDTAKQWRGGHLGGVEVDGGKVAFAEPDDQATYGGQDYDLARWTSPWVAPGFSYTQLIASWSAKTPGDSFIEIKARGRTAGGDITSWDILGRWAAGDKHHQRRTISGQADDGTSVNVDTWEADGGLPSYQLRITLLRRKGTTARPSVDLATVMTSRLPRAAGATSEPGAAAGTVLDVPRYSQMIHKGHYDKWGGGGEAWCSPTSTSMVLAYYDKLPSPKRYAWVPDDHTDPWVDHAARMTYDYAYGGTGNWPFNTAYAAPLAGKAFVTRLRSLREAEKFIAVGIPLIVSISFEAGQLDGAPIGSSDGHLLVIAGFQEDGDVVVNDPAADTSKGVRRVYERGQFEKIWLEAAGGLTYVIHDAAHPLPPGKHSNW
ncbi:MAG TPA: peptidase C39 family protein [Nocardioides sp.]|nr:peptidase C39 family protein [Nocardioides sp.]